MRILLILSDLFDKKNELQRALDTLQEGLDQSKDSIEIHFRLGALYDKLGNFERWPLR